MLPTLILYGLFQGWPLLMSVYYSLLDWSGIGKEKTFVGLQNFIELLKDEYFWNAYKNSFVFAAGTVPLLLVISLATALVLNQATLKAASLYRTAIFMPIVTTASTIGVLMVFILGANGPVNHILQNLGLLNRPISWLSDTDTALFTAMLVYVWKNLGTSLIYWLTALQVVPRDVLEASKIDGANRFQSFRYITIFYILPIGAVIALLNIAGALRSFDLIQTMTGGGPFFKTDVVSTYIYRYAFSSEMGLPRLGYASAAGILFGITIILIALVQYVLTNRLKRTQ